MRLSRTIHTQHGSIVTPLFMPDATRAALRGIPQESIVHAGVEMMVVNTYHLMLRPGAAAIVAAGGVHRFMGWDRPLLSDSGGYQVYSLIHRHKELGMLSEEGARFRSVLDGSWHLLTPERAIAIQADLGVDMMVVLDDPRPNDADAATMHASVERTVRWAARCRAAYAQEAVRHGWTAEKRPLLFAVIQGGTDVALRQQCAAALRDVAQTVSDGFGTTWDGMGFGGRHVDAAGTFLTDVVAMTAAAIPQETISFALGIGTPDDIVRCSAYGWEMFDCVIPTREGRHGRAFVWRADTEQGIVARIAHPADNDTVPFYDTVTIRNEIYRDAYEPIDATCACGCAGYTRAYVRHLFASDDPLGPLILARHNIAFYQRVIAVLRRSARVVGESL